MKDPLAEKLKEFEAPAPRADARAAARRAALEEFARIQATRTPVAEATPNNPRQGFWSRLRLSRQESTDGSADMKWSFSRTAWGGVASVAVVSFAAALLWPMFMGNPELQRMQPPGETVVRQEKLQQPESQQPTSGVVIVPGQTTQPSQPVRQLPEPRIEAPVGSVPMPEPIIVTAPSEAPASTATSTVVGALPVTPAVQVSAGSDVEEVVVSSARGKVRSSLEAKRDALQRVDAITAEDIGRLPDKSAAEALQRMNGVSLAKNEVARQGFVLPAPAPKDAEAPFTAEGDDKFQHFDVNPIKRVADDPVSTFSVDVDTASYSFARRLINAGRLPPKDAVRVEEMINYFDYAWPKPASRKVPFEATVAVGDSPWNKGKKLVHIGIKGFELDRDQQPDSNLVFLMDVSGSMDSPDKLPLAVATMKMLLPRLKPTDTVAIVVYAGAAGTVLEPTPVRDEDKILKALDSLHAGGSTAGAAGIALAYNLAERTYHKGGVNRVILATDGDFNVGIDGTEALKSFVERKREKGIFLSVLGFGQGNYRDELAQALAQNGNGVAAYIDTPNEARKVMVEQATGSLFTIAKDVKLQVEFNPATVAEYRLVGYETRALKREDFNNDRIDAGDVGAGHTVTALYEITPVGSTAVSVDELRYGDKSKPKSGSKNEYGFLKIRYKLPDEDTSQLVTQPIPLETPRLAAFVQREVSFSTAVAGFAQLLKGGAYTGKLGYDDIIEAAQAAKGEDRNGYRAEFIDLVKKAKSAKEM